MPMKTSGAFMKPWVLFLAAMFISGAPGAACETVEELTLEQAQQVAENFQALRDSLSQGKEQVEALQQKIARIKQHQDWLNNPTYGRKLQQALDALEANGLTSKLQATHDTLSTISRSADLINDKAEQIKGHFDKVKDFYDKWHPDSNNPVRPLELVGNGLEELESLIQKIDPSPDNMLTKPITAIISYYRQASQAFAGALTRVQEQIEERRQHCIGTGCENNSVRARAYTAKFPGTGPVWLYRPLPEGEVWYDGEGRAFLWWNGRWEELQGGINRFEEVNRGWHLAHGEIITTDNLLARMNHDYQLVIEAGRRAVRYWDMLNTSDNCHGAIFRALKQRQLDRDRILTDANSDRETFIARYQFLQSARNSVDALAGAFDTTLLVNGTVVDEQGNGVAGAGISAKGPGGSASAVSGSGGTFALQFNLRPDPTSRQNAAVTISHPDYTTRNSEQRLWQQCEDWQITLNASEQDTGAAAIAEMQAIRDGVLTKAAEVEGMCQDLQDQADHLEGQLTALPVSNPTQATPINATVELQQLAREAGELARVSDARAKAMAELSQGLSARINQVCDTVDVMQSTRDGGKQHQIYQGMQTTQQQAAGDLALLRSGFAELDGYARQAGVIKNRVTALRNATPPPAQSQGGPEQLEASRQALARARSQGAAAAARLQELEASRTRAAYIIYQRQQTGTEIAVLEGLFTGISSARDRAATCVLTGSARLDTLAARLDEAAAAGTTSPEGAGASEDPAGMDRIDAVADDVINNAFLAERFFSVDRMENKLGEGTACLASAQGMLSPLSQGDLEAALNNCDLTRAAQYAARGDADPALVQRYNKLRLNETAVAAAIRQSEALLENCEFQRALQVLQQATNTGACEASMNNATRAVLTIKANARRAAMADQDYASANEYYRRRDYPNAYRSLQQAGRNAVCVFQRTRINNGLRQVAAQLQNEAGAPVPGNAGVPPATAGNSDNPICRQYQQELQILTNEQQRMAREVMHSKNQEQTPEQEARIQANARQVVITMDKARAAGCVQGGEEIPSWVREGLGVPPR